MLTYEMYSEVMDEIVESGNISKALIEEAEEEPMVSVQKHIGHCIRVLMDTHRIDHMACDNMLKSLLTKHGGPHACKPHALSAIDEINHKLILFTAVNTHFDGRYDDLVEDDDDDFGAMDPFVDINS